MMARSNRGPADSATENPRRRTQSEKERSFKINSGFTAPSCRSACAMARQRPKWPSPTLGPASARIAAFISLRENLFDFVNHGILVGLRQGRIQRQGNLTLAEVGR